MEIADQPEKPLSAPPGRTMDGRRDGLIDLALAAGFATDEGLATDEGAPPEVALRSLDTLWFQVGGTLCNLACTHCFISCSPTNHTHEMMGFAEVERYLEEAAAL